MKLIWYNPHTREYCSGSMSDFTLAKEGSKSPDKFEILFELNDSNGVVAERIVNELNGITSGMKVNH